MDKERFEQLYVPPTQVTVTGFKAIFYARRAVQHPRVYLVIVVDDTRRKTSGTSEHVRITDNATSWSYRFSGTINSLGTFDNPAITRVELWGERFLRDTFLGSVSVPLPKFADGVANDFKLPLFAPNSNGADPEALLDFSIQTSMDMNKMMTESEIDVLFHNMSLGKGESLTPRDFSAAEKWAKLMEEKRKKEETEKKTFERNRPAHFVALLRDDKMRDFDWKRIRFNMTDLHWQQEFLEFSGLDFLFYQLGKVVLNLKSRVVQHTKTDFDRVASLLICIQRIVSFVFGNISLYMSHDYVDLLVQCLEFVDGLQDKLLVFEIIKMLLSSVHYQY